MTKQTPRQRKALRSIAAKKGWETRRDKAVQADFWRRARLASKLNTENLKPRPNPTYWQRLRSWLGI